MGTSFTISKRHIPHCYKKAGLFLWLLCLAFPFFCFSSEIPFEKGRGGLPPPTFTGCPPTDIVVSNTPGQCDAQVTWTPPSASPDAVSITSNYSPGERFLPGVTTVIYRAENALGEEATCSFTVTVVDAENPELTGPADLTVPANNAGCTAIVNYATPTATDNCVPSVGIYPIFEDFEVPSRNDLIAECWTFLGTVTSTNNPLSGASSMRTSGLFNGSRTLISPLTYFNGTGEISFIHRINGFSGTTTLEVYLEDESGARTEIYSYLFTTTAVQSVRIPITQTGLFRVRIDFTSTVSQPFRGWLDDLLIPGLKISDPSRSCSPAVLEVVQTAGLPSGAAFPLGTTTNAFEVSDVYGNTDTYTFEVTVTDDEDPTITPGTDITVMADAGMCTALVTVPPPVTSDNCSVASVIYTPLGAVAATGGSVTDFISGSTRYGVHTFNSSGTLTVTNGGVIDYLIVAGGGGGGGGWQGGGGGAGGVLQNSASVTASPYDVIVGAGGNGANQLGSGVPGADGGNSSIIGIATAIGGGRGGSEGPTYAPGEGGSGGGGSHYSVPRGIGANGVVGQGNRGGNSVGFSGNGGPPIRGVGGGGSGGPGLDNGSTAPGPGLTISITGSPVIYARGGIGRVRTAPANDGESGPPNTGFGGNGGDSGPNSARGGNGGSGVVIVRYINGLDGSTGFTDTFPIGTTTITWTVTDASGNSTTATQNITVEDITAPLTPTLSEFTGQCSVIPVAPTTTDDCDTGLITGTTSTVFPITTLGTTTVTWTFTDTSGNSTTATQDIRVESSLPEPEVNTPLTYCEGDTAVPLTATGTSLLWYMTPTGGTGDPSAPVPDTSTPGTTSYWVSQQDAGGCEGPRAEILVQVNALPTVTANASQTTINAGEPVILSGSGADSYVWDNGVADGDTVFPTTTTTYSVTGTDLNGCSSSDSITIAVNPSSDLSLIKAVDNPEPLIGDEIRFTLTVLNDGPDDLPPGGTVTDLLPLGYTYISDTGSSTNGSYTAGTGEWSLPGILSGNSAVLEIRAAVNPPTGATGEYLNIAEVSSSPHFDPDSTPGNDDGDQSEDDEDSAEVSPGNTDLEVRKASDVTTAAIGDQVLFTVSVTNVGTTGATNAGISEELPPGFLLENALADAGTYDAQTGTWDIPSLQPGETALLDLTVTVTETPPYTNIAQLIYLDQIDNNTSNDRDEVTVEVIRTDCLIVYNEFSPNNDGANETFFIECIEEYPQNFLQVFNRWGNLVFEQRSYDNSWTGTRRASGQSSSNDELPAGTYYYLLDPGDGSEVRTGWLYIAR